MENQSSVFIEIFDFCFIKKFPFTIIHVYLCQITTYNTAHTWINKNYFLLQAQEEKFNARVYGGDSSKYVWFGVGTFGTQEANQNKRH
jgi:hypothetical protein